MKHSFGTIISITFQLFWVSHVIIFLHREQPYKFLYLSYWSKSDSLHYVRDKSRVVTEIRTPAASGCVFWRGKRLLRLSERMRIVVVCLLEMLCLSLILTLKDRVLSVSRCFCQDVSGILIAALIIVGR